MLRFSWLLLIALLLTSCSADSDTSGPHVGTWKLEDALFIKELVESPGVCALPVDNQNANVFAGLEGQIYELNEDGTMVMRKESGGTQATISYSLKSTPEGVKIQMFEHDPDRLSLIEVIDDGSKLRMIDGLAEYTFIRQDK